MSVVASPVRSARSSCRPGFILTSGGALAAGDHLGASLDGVGDVRSTFSTAFMLISDPITAPGDLHRSAGLGQPLGERLKPL